MARLKPSPYSRSAKRSGERKRRMRIQRLGILAVISAITAACSGEAVQSTPQRPAGGGGRGGGAQGPVPVLVATAVRKAMPITISSIGTAEPSQTVSVRAQITGELTDVGFKEGD